MGIRPYYLDRANSLQFCSLRTNFPRPIRAPPSPLKGALQRHRLLGIQRGLSIGHAACARSLKFIFGASMLSSYKAPFDVEGGGPKGRGKLEKLLSMAKTAFCFICPPLQLFPVVQFRKAPARLLPHIGLREPRKRKQLFLRQMKAKGAFQRRCANIVHRGQNRGRN